MPSVALQGVGNQTRLAAADRFLIAADKRSHNRGSHRSRFCSQLLEGTAHPRDGK